MEKEIIIERKKSKSIRISLFIFIITLIMIKKNNIIMYISKKRTEMISLPAK